MAARHDSQKSPAVPLDRRNAIKCSLAAGSAGLIAATNIAGGPASAAEPLTLEGVRHGRIKQSIVQWCFNKWWTVEQTCQVARRLGCASVELVAPEHWPTLRKHGLTCAIASSHSFVQGMNNPNYHDGCIAHLRDVIDVAAAAHVPTVITFTGFAQETGPWNNGRAPDMSQLAGQVATVIDPDEGLRNCVAGFKRIVGHAEKQGVKLSLEMLNSRVDETMKGHPGYQGDHIDYCLEIVKQVGSPAFGLLFDIYHVQIMDGDVIRRIHACGEAINHVHTAGNPGRNELDDRQEINYPPIMRALLDIGYTGYVGQEFIPTGNPEQGMAQAVQVCDVA